MMDALEMEENLFVAGDAKLHGEMVRMLSDIVCKVLEIFPYIESARPRSKSGIQALCSLHVALDKAKGLLQHCSDCSKLYLAITGDSILMKFEKAKHALKESLKRVEDIVPEAIGCQIVEVAAELDETVFALDDLVKQTGDQVISLLQKDRKSDSDSNDSEELEVFHQAALRLGITTFRAALIERRALKKLIERARAEEDKRKESIVSYLYHLMRKYSKFFRSEFADDTDSQGSAPCSPTISFQEAPGTYSNGYTFDGQLSKLRSFNFKQTGRISGGGMAVPPEEFRCPISLQLMYDPVIISSGQTYERACIEKWFSDGHSNCPKTQQQLTHLSLTPNYCVKGLIASWCEHNGVPIPSRPPDSLDVNYRNLASFQGEAMYSLSSDNVNSCNQKVVDMVHLEENVTSEEFKQNDSESPDDCFDQYGGEGDTERYESLLAILQEESMQKKCRAVQQMRNLLKDNEEARNYMGANGAVDALVDFLRLALQDGDQEAQEAGAMALFNLAVNNKRNKELLISAGLLSLMEEMISNSESQEYATALYLNLSCLEDAKSIIGSSESLTFLVQLLHDDSAENTTCKHDALYTLYNLSTYPPNIPALLSTSVISYLHSFLVPGAGRETWAEKALAVIINLASSQVGREEIVSTPSLVSNLVGFLDMGDPTEQEQSVSCLLILCNGDEECSRMVLQEGAIPSLVSISANGTARGKDKAQKLLQLFREQRQREQAEHAQNNGAAHQLNFESKALSKSRSKKIGRALSSIWKSKHFSVYQCSSW